MTRRTLLAACCLQHGFLFFFREVDSSFIFLIGGFLYSAPRVLECSARVIRPPGFDSPATRRTMHLRPSPSPPSILPGLGLGQHLQTNGPAPQIASRAAVAVSNLWRCTDCLCEMYIRCSIVQIVNVILLHRVCPCKESRIPFVLLSCVISCPPIWP